MSRTQDKDLNNKLTKENLVIVQKRYKSAKNELVSAIEKRIKVKESNSPLPPESPFKGLETF
jgi:hypothetical protein